MFCPFCCHASSEKIKKDDSLQSEFIVKKLAVSNNNIKKKRIENGQNV
jgi:hypothetical protein